MSVFKCKMCGGDIDLTEGSSVAVCEYCGTKQTVPTADNEKKMTLFARANRLRSACEFDKAASVYESIVADFPEEAEAYWGLVLCRYGIEYVDDPATGRKVPTCHRSSFDSILEDSDFEQACENADPIARRVYRDEAKTIEDIRKGIVEVSGKEPPYDIFICYKETDEKCSATSFLRNWDSILEKKRANLRSISEPARLRQPPPRSTGAAHARGRAQSIREERRIAAPPVLFALLWVRLLPALYGPFCGPLRPFGGCPWGVTPPARECLPPAPPDTRRRG